MNSLDFSVIVANHPNHPHKLYVSIISVLPFQILTIVYPDYLRQVTPVLLIFVLAEFVLVIYVLVKFVLVIYVLAKFDPVIYVLVTLYLS